MSDCEQEGLEQIFSYRNIGKISVPSPAKPGADAELGGTAAPRLYFIGIKGTGMCALAQLLKYLGYEVSGSDVAEHFYTDELLAAAGIPCAQGFDPANLPALCDLIIYSAAYDESNPEYAAARLRRGELLMLSYPEVLGYISRVYQTSVTIIGSHGKTTTTLLASALLQSLALPASALAGAGAAHLDGNAYLSQGPEALFAEACEYRNHFFQFEPEVVLLTSLEWDHQDFFSTYSMMQQSFRDFLAKDSIRTVVYCADDPGVRELVAELERRERVLETSLLFVPYGLSVSKGEDFAVERIAAGAGQTELWLNCQPELPLRLQVPGKHLALNALGALAALFHSGLLPRYRCFKEFLQAEYPRISQGLQRFHGASRRSELLGEIPWPPRDNRLAGKAIATTGVLVLDDYAHHPTAIRKTLAGLRRFYPQCRLVLDFMPHTYSRSRSLHSEFCTCFTDAEVLILHEVYGSAREQEGQGYSGRILWQGVNQSRREQGQSAAHFFSQALDALESLEQILQPGDLFVTMGAGNNRELGLALLQKWNRTESSA